MFKENTNDEIFKSWLKIPNIYLIRNYKVNYLKSELETLLESCLELKKIIISNYRNLEVRYKNNFIDKIQNEFFKILDGVKKIGFKLDDSEVNEINNLFINEIRNISVSYYKGFKEFIKKIDNILELLITDISEMIIEGNKLINKDYKLIYNCII
jgi:hypothetical protein